MWYTLPHDEREDRVPGMGLVLPPRPEGDWDMPKVEMTEEQAAKRLRDSARHAHRVRNQRVTRLSFRPKGARRRAGGAHGRPLYVKADAGG